MKRRSKRYKEILKTSTKDKKISVKDILDLVKKNSTTKFDESIDVSLKINLKQSKGGDLSLRTVVNLPNGSGKKSKIAVLCEPDKIDEAKKSGADVVGSDDLLEKIEHIEDFQLNITYQNNFKTCDFIFVPLELSLQFEKSIPQSFLRYILYKNALSDFLRNHIDLGEFLH